VIALVLLFVPFTFLTVTGLSNFCNLNLCFAAIFLSINIPVMPLFKSAFTVTLLYVSTFSTPMFSYISLNILNVFLISLCLFSFFVVLFKISVCTLLCYAMLFPLWSILLLPSSTIAFSLFYILDTRSLFFLVLILFLL